MRIVLVGCSKGKVEHNAPARSLYTGQLFRAARAYAEKCADAWFILSAKHGVLHPEQWVYPYAATLATLTRTERAAWGLQVKQQLVSEVIRLGLQGHSLANPHWVLLAGTQYRKPLYPGFLAGTVETPVAHLGYAQQVAWLKQQTAEV